MPAKMVINVRAQDTDLSPLDSPSSDVQKIIIGESPTADGAEWTDVPQLPLLETSFKNLTHLFLWKTKSLLRVPKLPPQQLVLEIRESTELTTIDGLPKSLRSLVLENCPLLKQLPEVKGRSFPNLFELTLAGCTAIDPAWIDDLIAASPKLQFIDLSRCSQVTRLLPNLPTSLDRLELNECKNLESLPDPLPLSLRRLGLKGASKIEHIPELRKAIDYVDLAMTTNLRTLPKFPALERDAKGDITNVQPQTLFLYGSGVLEPPASEHGASADTNVAFDTREYQGEVELVGSGTVRRCKLLLLGNGKAGKTKLALNVNPHLNSNQYNGTTHGIQFWDWPDYVAKYANEPCNVNLHMWDFGGQEIYHSTHRLFVSRGSVFVIVWNPDQDGKQPPIEEGYQDVWYPVRYWLDYIHMECPHNRPLVTIVCSHQGNKWHPGKPAENTKLKKELAARLRRDIGDEYADRCPLFVLDSEIKSGEKAELESWLKASVSSVVTSQGTVVPTYWEIGQNMVEQWLPKPDKEEPDSIAHESLTRLKIDEFADRFREAIEQQLQTKDQDTDYDKLRQQYNRKFLTKPRIQRTLRFLTHSGWIYWNANLFDSRVIIDQRWALRLAYSTLDRRPESDVYKRLVSNQGRFTFANLQDWCWRGETLDTDDQKLILSFMATVGICFPITQRYGSNEAVYISPTHLPGSNALCTEFDLHHLDQVQEVVESKQLHRGHWFAILREICRDYGDDATYTKEACLIRGSTYRWNREDKPWSALLRYQLDDEKNGLGGKILISVEGEQIREHLPALKRFTESFLPGFEGKASDAVDYRREFIDCVEEAPTVFLSFAWDPVGKIASYEEPVNAIEAALLPFKDRLKILRDKHTMQPGDYITEYVAKAGSQDVDLVLIFTSEKYWTSWWCMLELASVLTSLMKSCKGTDKSILVIAHESGNKLTAGDIAPILAHWNNLELVDIDGDEYPKNLPEQLLSQNWKHMRRKFVNILTDSSIPLSSDAIGIRKVWSSEASAEIIAWVLAKLRLPLEGGHKR